MRKQFQTIGLIGRLRSSESAETLKELYDFLSQNNYKIIIEKDTATLFEKNDLSIFSRADFGKHCDLVIVVGGDGSMLNAARSVVDYQKPVLGINRGRLGFLTDIHPTEINSRLADVLAGNYIIENRFLLNAEIRHPHDKKNFHDVALNDVVLLPGEYAQMIEFEIYINKQLVCVQRADGQIIATPTGSTAYALSGGGPILHPKLNAIVLVPMFSHTLSTRPIVVDSSSHIEIKISSENVTSPSISCDGQPRIPINPGDSLIVSRKKEELILLHHTDYNYFETLRTKLHWQKVL